MLVGRQQAARGVCWKWSSQSSFTGQSWNWPCPLNCLLFSFGLWLMGWHSSTSSLGLLTSFSFSESSAWASPLVERFLLGRALWDASVLSLPNYCLVNWNPYPKGHSLETSQVLRGVREKNVFSRRLSRLNYGAHCFQVPMGSEPCPTRRHIQPFETLSQYSWYPWTVLWVCSPSVK